MSKTTNFIKSVKGGALQLWDKFGILPSVAIGQAALESAWGLSSLAKKYNNLFGIKGSYKGNSSMMNTWEVYGGKRYDIKDSFRVYPDWSTSILDYGVFLTVNPRYKKAIGLTNYKDQIKAIHKAGYATDPNYANKVISIIEKYKLYELDKQVRTGAPSPTSPPPNKYTTYRVVKGDNLSKIARKFNTDLGTLLDINHIPNANLIYAGQVLNVPNTKKTYHRIKRGETLSGIARDYNTSVNALVRLNGIKDPDKIYAGTQIRIQ